MESILGPRFMNDNELGKHRIPIFTAFLFPLDVLVIKTLT